jgi:hypothetical protein
MKRIVRVAACALGVAAGAVALSVVGARASDHLDGPRATSDPQSDLTDVFAFTSPADPSRVVFAMAVTPYATDASAFSPLVDYAFRIQLVEALSPLTLDPTVRDVVCDFDDASPQHVTCEGPGGITAKATVGDEAGGTGLGMRVFAGLRSDPAFFDRQGAIATMNRGIASFTGVNAFAGANVLAIVVEADRAAFTLEGDAGYVPGSGAATDGGTDAGADARADAGSGAGADAGADASAGPDAGADAGPGAGGDAGPGTGADAGPGAATPPILAVAAETFRRGH